MTHTDPRTTDIARSCAAIIDAHTRDDEPDLDTLLTLLTLLTRKDDPLFITAVAAGIAVIALDVALRLGFLGHVLLFWIKHKVVHAITDEDMQTHAAQAKIAASVNHDAAWIAQIGVEQHGREKAAELTHQLVETLAVSQ